MSTCSERTYSLTCDVLVIGLAINLLFLVALCVCTKINNKPAETAGAVFTLLIALTYAMFLECPALVYSSELFPSEWRAFGVSTSISISFFGQLIFTAAAPTALRTMGAYFYVIFIGLTALQFVIAILYFPNVCLSTKTNSRIVANIFADKRFHLRADVSCFW